MTWRSKNYYVASTAGARMDCESFQVAEYASEQVAFCVRITRYQVTYNFAIETFVL